MTDEKSKQGDKTAEGAELWRRARATWADTSEPAPEAPDPLVLAAYLDGRLDEQAAAELEARLAGDPALLDELLALRAGLAEAPEDAPAVVVARARALRRSAAPASPDGPGFFARFFGGWLRPAVPVFAVLALMIACAGAFELGRQQSEQILLQQAAGSGEADLPDPLSLDIPI